MTTIVATSPGDIVIEFGVQVASTGKRMKFDIPVKTLSVTKSMDVSPEYGIGNHQAYAHVVGKISYEGDFTVGSWIVDKESNPSTWNYLITEFLTYQDDQGLPREFDINVYARGGLAMTRQGTGQYVSGSSTNDTLPTEELNETGQSSDNLLIESYQRCILKGDGTDIPEVGGTVSRKYPFQCFRRTPK
jgi:hypothetical protein